MMRGPELSPEVQLGRAFGTHPENELSRNVSIKSLKIWPKVTVSDGRVITSGEPKRVPVSIAARVFENFLELRDGKPKDVERFVKKFGPLCICEDHGMPVGGLDFLHAGNRRIRFLPGPCRGYPPKTARFFVGPKKLSVVRVYVQDLKEGERDIARLRELLLRRAGRRSRSRHCPSRENP